MNMEYVVVWTHRASEGEGRVVWAHVAYEREGEVVWTHFVSERDGSKRHLHSTSKGELTSERGLALIRVSVGHGGCAQAIVDINNERFQEKATIGRWPGM